MKKVVLATTNINKVKRLKRLLHDLDIELISIDAFDIKVSEPNETGLTCGSIALEKAAHYVQFLPKSTLVLTQDDTIAFDGVSEDDNPGVHIKEPVINKYGEFTDELAIKYYTELADKYGGHIPMTFHYGHAIAMKSENKRNTTKVLSSESKLETRLVNKSNKEIVKGYFLSSIMKVKINDEWVYHNDLTEEQLIEIDGDLHESIKILLKGFERNE